MGEGNEKSEKRERRFSQEQYDMLLRCSEKKDMTEWNEWRKEHPDEEILLEGADLKRLKLCPNYYPRYKRKGILFLKENEDKLVNLSNAYLKEAKLQGTILDGANLEEAELLGANLNNSTLIYANLKGADLMYASLENAVVADTFLQGAIVERCNLRNASFAAARVDGSTIVWKPQVSRYQRCYKVAKNHEWMGERYYTHFEGVPLETLRIDPKTKQLLEYNIRRNNWENWYKYVDPYAEEVELRERNFLVKLCLSFIRCFWSLSDYGMSTGRVIIWFFVLAFLFAAVYMNWGYWRPPGIVSNLVVQPEVGEAVWHYFGRALIRPVYFSIVTMTTLGFGDMYANKGSIAGHVILAVQVILGYVLLGALITRFAVLFTAGGPAGRFSKEK